MVIVVNFPLYIDNYNLDWNYTKGQKYGTKLTWSKGLKEVIRSIFTSLIGKAYIIFTVFVYKQTN